MSRQSWHQRALLALAVLVVGSVVVVNRADAQGTMGMLPGPISTTELDGYAQRLQLSPQQRRGLDALHDQYKQEFRALREGEIAAFLAKMREMDGGALPKRKMIEDFLEQMDALSRKIASLDNRFFDQLPASLTEEQLTMMPRVRLARQRGRMENMQIMWMGGERPLDVSALAFGMELSDADRTTADPVLSQYETKLTSEMEKLYEHSHKTIMGMYEALEKLGIDETAAQDPEQMEKVGQAMQQIWMDMMAKTSEKLREVSDLNERTQKSITASLSPEGARTFRNQYYRHAYAEATFALYSHDYVFAPALKRDDLTPEQRTAIGEIRDEMQRKLDAILDEAVAQILEYRRSVNPFEYSQERAQKYQEEQNALRQKADEARLAANTALEAALGKDLLDKIGRLKSAGEEPQEEMIVDAGGDMATMVQTLETPSENDNEDFAWGMDQFLPPAISEADIKEYSDRLELTEEQRSVVHDLYRTYSQSFQKLSENEIGRLQKATTSMWQWNEQTQTSTAPTSEAINETYKLRSAALEAIRKTDESFFGEMEVGALTPEQAKGLQRVKAARERATYNRGAYYWGGDNNEGAIDLSRLVLRRRSMVPPEQWKSIDAELEKYEQAALPLFKDRYARSLDAQKVQEQWQAEITRAQAAGDMNNVKLGMRYQEMMREPQEALGKASDAVGSLNRKTMDSIIALLPSEASGTLRSEYNRRAYPGVYNDDGCVEKHLDRARALTDLSPEQAQQLADAAAAYYPAYSSICQEMVTTSAGSQRNPWMAGVADEEGAKEWQKREETLARLRFDRSELNARAASQIKSILTEEQLKRLGGLPNIGEQRDFDF